MAAMKQAWDWERCGALVAGLDDKVNPPVADENASHRDLWALDYPYVQEVVDRVGLTFADFVELDERPGKWGYKTATGGEWHYRLRRWRNHAPSFLVWCKQATDVERAKRVKAEKARLKRRARKAANDWDEPRDWTEIDRQAADSERLDNLANEQ